MAMVVLLLGSISTPEAAGNRWIRADPLLIAHQGGDDEFPSNTLYAYRRARRAGAEMLELDIGVSRDGHVVVMHDTTVNRITNGRGKMSSKTLRQINGWTPPTGSRGAGLITTSTAVGPALPRHRHRQADRPEGLHASGLPGAHVARGSTRLSPHADQHRDQGPHEAGADERVRAKREVPAADSPSGQAARSDRGLPSASGRSNASTRYCHGSMSRLLRMESLTGCCAAAPRARTSWHSSLRSPTSTAAYSCRSPRRPTSSEHTARDMRGNRGSATRTGTPPPPGAGWFETVSTAS